jgi:hypothetical protein
MKKIQIENIPVILNLLLIVNYRLNYLGLVAKEINLNKVIITLCNLIIITSNPKSNNLNINNISNLYNLKIVTSMILSTSSKIHHHNL